MEVAKPEPEEKELTTFLILLIVVICIGSVQGGFSLWLVNDPVTRKQYYHNLTAQIVEKKWDNQMHPAVFIFTVSSYLLGCLLGTVLFAPLADKYGRKATLMINDVFMIFTSVVLVVSKSFNSHGFFALARFLTGTGAGIFSCAVPIFLEEIGPINLRGGVTIVNSVFVSIGVMISQVLGGREFLGNPKGLPFLRSIPGILALFQFVLLLPFPESPRYLLIQKGNKEGARQALQKLRGQEDVEDEIEELYEEDQYEMNEKKMTIFKLLLCHDQRWQLICVVILIVSQQCSGVNAAYHYADTIFLAVKLDEDIFRYLSASGTFLLHFGQILSIYKIDSWGRRSLLLLGFGICIICCVLLTMSLELQDTLPWTTYVSCLLLFVFLTGFIIGPNSIPHLMIGELFLQSSRASAYAIGSFVQWFFIFFIFFTYVLLEKHIRAYCFLIFLPFCAVGFYYILKIAPETKKKTILDIRKVWASFLARKFLNEKPAAKKKPVKR